MAAPARSAQSDIDMILGGGLGGSKTPPAGPEVRNDPSIKPLRTFKTDAEEAIRYQNISAAQIAMAEQKKKEEAAAAKPQPGQTADREGGGSRAGLVLILLFLFALVGGGGYYYWFYMRTDAPASTPRVPAGLKVSSLVPYDAADIVTIGQNDDAIASIALKLASAPIQIGQTFVAVPVPTGTTTVKAEIASVLSNTRIPPMLERSLATEYTVGTRLFNANSPFLVFKNTFFQNAYAGMLEWERTMRSDFSALIRVAHPDEPAVDTSSAAFVDSVVSNIDARVLRNAAGQTVLAYAFADRDTAVIAMDEETLAYVLDKLLAVRIVQ